jgi:hypothetical protein
MRILSANAGGSEALPNDHAYTDSKAGTDCVRYYFEVGNPVDRSKMVFVGRDGRLISGDTDLSLIRTFRTMRAANQFFDMMDGRYGGRPLFLRSTIRKLPPVT